VALYVIHRLKDTARQQFKWAPHTIGPSTARPKDYEAGDTVDAPSPYAAWIALRETVSALQVGDILESDAGDLRIYKYVGFENVQWQVPEIKAAAEIPVGSTAVDASSTTRG